jgi:hypothetical protein
MVSLNDARKLPGLLDGDSKQPKVHHWCRSACTKLQCKQTAMRQASANTPGANWGALVLCRSACMLDVAKGMSGEATHHGVL